MWIGNHIRFGEEGYPLSVPISLLVDDSCPLIHVFRHHWEDVHGREPKTAYGARLLDVISNVFLDRFCQVAAERAFRLLPGGYHAQPGGGP